MSECANVEIRELLPEYLHGRLAASERVRVEGHVAGCEDCSAELTTLRMVRQAYSHAPVPDVAAIVRALPRPSNVRSRQTSRALAWRIAAAISFISLGGISLVVARSFFQNDRSATQVDSTRLAPVATAALTVPARPGITFAGGVSDLATEDVEKLLGSIESLEAAPPVEPDAISVNDRGRVKSDSSGE
jgi:anti-sigma factor RsiW